MKQSEQINALSDDLRKIIERYRAEFEISCAAFIGVLELIKADLITEMQNPENFGGDDEEESFK